MNISPVNRTNTYENQSISFSKLRLKTNRNDETKNQSFDSVMDGFASIGKAMLVKNPREIAYMSAVKNVETEIKNKSEAILSEADGHLERGYELLDKLKKSMKENSGLRVKYLPVIVIKAEDGIQFMDPSDIYTVYNAKDGVIRSVKIEDPDDEPNEAIKSFYYSVTGNLDSYFENVNEGEDGTRTVGKQFIFKHGQISSYCENIEIKTNKSFRVGKSFDFTGGKLTKFDDKMRILEDGTVKIIQSMSLNNRTFHTDFRVVESPDGIVKQGKSFDFYSN
jgi:hypothetical protein